MFDFTNSKPALTDIWETLKAEPKFGVNKDLLQANISRTIMWVLLSTTTNFPATKKELNKFLDGKITFTDIQEGFLQAIKGKYGINLNVTNPIQLQHLDSLPAPEKLKEPYYLFIQMFNKNQHEDNSIELIKHACPGLDLKLYSKLRNNIWGDLDISVFTIQTRFNEFLVGDNFRKYFPALKDSTKFLEEITVKSVEQIPDILKDRLLTTYVDYSSNTYYEMSIIITLESKNNV